MLPYYGNAWTSPVTFQVQGKDATELTTSKLLFDLKGMDVLTISCGEPIAPWNATIVKVGKELVLVGLARPGAHYDLEKWEAGKGGKEELPNSALFIAKYGDHEMAKRLAKAHMATGNERVDHISVVLSVGLENFKEENLAKTIEQGFKALQRKLPADGPSIGDELEAARKLLKEGRPKAPPRT